MAVLFLTQDLIFFSRVAAAAERVGAKLQAVSSMEEVTQPLQSGGVDLVILDLSSNQFDPVELTARLRELSTDPPAVVAYAPHVHVARLEAARAAGCAEVLTRGQFDRQMTALLEKYAAI